MGTANLGVAPLSGMSVVQVWPSATKAPAPPPQVPDLMRAWEVAAAAQFAADGDSSGWDEPPRPLTAEQRYVKVCSCALWLVLEQFQWLHTLSRHLRDLMLLSP